MRCFLLASILAALVVHADDLTPEKRAQLQREQQKASEAVDKKYGNKKPSELSSAERKSQMKEKAAAEREVLEKAGVDPKDFARSTMKMSRDEKADTDAAMRGIFETKDAEKEAAAKKPGKKEVVIEKNSQGGGEVNEAAEMDKKMGLGKGKK